MVTTMLQTSCFCVCLAQSVALCHISAVLVAEAAIEYCKLRQGCCLLVGLVVVLVVAALLYYQSDWWHLWLHCTTQ